MKELQNGKRTLFAVLIDPDKFNPHLVQLANDLHVDCFLVGGSYLYTGRIDQTIKKIKEISDIPLVLFPGDESQLHPKADGVLLPALLSGRNPDYLIGKQILMAPIIKQMKLKHAALAYLLLDGDKKSSTQKVTHTTPISTGNKNLIVHTALAAAYLGYDLLYLEAGSGAKKSVPLSTINAVKKQVGLPIIVGGGINSVQKVKAYIKARVNMIVVGNALEKDINLLHKLSPCFNQQI